MDHKHTSISIYALVDPGHTRAHQEDSIGYVEFPIGANTNALYRGHLLVLADGVGGREAGEIASSVAVQTILESYYSLPAITLDSCLKNALLRANSEIWRQKEKQNASRMATTVVCAVIDGTRLLISHLGDSRAYLLRAGQLKQLTEDHSEDEYTITRSLGAERVIEPEVSTFAIESGDRLLLCSDGLHGLVRDETIKGLLVTHSNLESACVALADHALSAGGRDNISLLITQIGPIETPNSWPSTPWTEINRFSQMRLASPLDWENQEEENLSEHGAQKARWPLAVVTMVLLILLLSLIAYVYATSTSTNQHNMLSPTPTFGLIASPTPTQTTQPATPTPTKGSDSPINPNNGQYSP